MITGRARLKLLSELLVKPEQAAWNDDETVLRHELGHVLVWYWHGGTVIRLRYTRASDGLLHGAARMAPRSLSQTETPEYIDANTERVL